MSRRRRCLVVRVAAVVLLVGAAALARADDFAGARMSDGIEAYRSRQFAEASDQFRIACFGLLDQPVRLSEGLVRLALAQEALGRKEGVTAALKRFLEVEKRFGAYSGARVDAGMRGEFEALLFARVPAETLAAVPSLSRQAAQAVVAEQAPAVSPPEAVPLAAAPPVAAPSAAAPPTVEPLDITPPVPLETPAPAYPDLARRARAEGNVLVEAMIGADGSVHEARILRSASPLLNDAALEAVRRWRYSPARVGARPVSVSTSVVVTFSRRGLDRGQTP